MSEEWAGRPSAERRETGGRGSAHAPRRTRGARSRLRGDEATHGVSRMRAAGADARRTAARPRTARKAEGPTRRTRPEVANAARFGAAAGRNACRAWRIGQDCGLRLTSRSPHGRQDAQVARPEAGAPLPRSALHVGKRQDTRAGPTGQRCGRLTGGGSSLHAEVLQPISPNSRNRLKSDVLARPARRMSARGG